jgi:hypothetical protein
MRSFLPSAASLAVLALTMQPAPAVAQAATSAQLAPPAAVRITSPVTDGVRATLPGYVAPKALAPYDQGAASASLATGRIALLLHRDPARQEALREYLGDLQNPHSASYHKWLTPQQYGAQFGIAPQDLQTVEAWLQAQGFQIRSVPAGGNMILFSGTVGQVEQAFQTSIHSYAIQGVRHVAEATPLSIPAALAPVVAGISPLNDFRAQPQQLTGDRAQVQLAADNSLGTSGRLKVLAKLPNSGNPQLVETNTTGETLYVTPADAATIYDAPNSLNSGYTGNTQQNGSGVNIGFAEYSDLATADYLNYRKLFLNEATPSAPTLVVDGVDPGVLDQSDGQEALTDTEIAAGLAPGANIYVYSSQSDLMENGLIDAALRAIEDNQVSILDISYSICESNLEATGNLEVDELWQEAAAQGITVVAATGNYGSGACYDGSGAVSNSVEVNGYASTPYDVAVGGTDFDTLGLNLSQYLNTTNPSNLPTQTSVTGYIPENPWNDSITNNPPGDYDTNVAGIYGTGAIIAGTGGGASYAAYCVGTIDAAKEVCNGSYGGYPTPPFQTGITVTPDAQTGVRYLPDVSMFAGTNQQYPSTWALCSDNAVAQGSGTFVDCEPDSSGNFTVETAGGTAASSAAFAGVLGMVSQSLGGARLGQADNVLYNLYANNAGVYHDITAGNNSQPCYSGPSCGSNDFLLGYNATPGYDLASGLGSVDIGKLITAWPSVVFTPTTTTLEVNGNTTPLSITHGTDVTLSTTVSPTDATGSVSVTGTNTGETGGGANPNETIPLTNGARSVTVNNLPGGTYSLSAYYAGDMTHAASSSTPPIQVTVGPENSTTILSLDVDDATTIQPIVPPTSFPYGAYGFVYVQPQSATNGNDGTPTGTVMLLNNGSSFSGGGSQILNSKGTAAFPVQDFAPGTYSLTASYSGDLSYNPSTTASSTTVTISQAATALTAILPQSTASPQTSISIDQSGTTTVMLTLTADSSGAYPTGTFTLTGNGNSFPMSGTPRQILTTANTVEETATFTVAGSALALGTNTLTASYSGDGNYTAGTSNPVTITVNGISPPTATPTFMLTSPIGGVTVATLGTPATGTLTVTPLNGFTGTVSLSCAVTPNTGANSPTCTIDPSVTLTSITPATATLTISTTRGSAALMAPHQPWGAGTGKGALHRLLEGSGGLSLCALLLWIAPARRRALRSLLVVLLAFGALGMIGCGVTLNGSKAGAYTATVTGTSGSTVVTTQVSITVP